MTERERVPVSIPEEIKGKPLSDFIVDDDKLNESFYEELPASVKALLANYYQLSNWLRLDFDNNKSSDEIAKNFWEHLEGVRTNNSISEIEKINQLLQNQTSDLTTKLEKNLNNVFLEEEEIRRLYKIQKILKTKLDTVENFLINYVVNGPSKYDKRVNSIQESNIDAKKIVVKAVAQSISGNNNSSYNYESIRLFLDYYVQFQNHLSLNKIREKILAEEKLEKDIQDDLSNVSDQTLHNWKQKYIAYQDLA